MLRDRKFWQAFLNAAEMLAEAFSKSTACFADVDGGATAARDAIYQARRLTGESILDGNCAVGCCHERCNHMCGSGCVCKEKFPREDQVGYGQRCALRCPGRCDRGDRLLAAAEGIFLLFVGRQIRC